MFIARISKGRSIREVINFSLAGPVMYTVTWFCVFGSAGLRMERRATELVALGVELEDNPEMFGAERFGCYDPPATFDYPCGASNDTCTYLNSDGAAIGPVCIMGEVGQDNMWFLVLDQYYDFGTALSLLSLFAIAVYFVTSSDSGSLVVDHLASNGSEEHHVLQRVFWAFTEGAVATALLVAGGNKALSALQAASIVCGLPFTLFLCFMMVSLYRICANETLVAKKGPQPAAKEFALPCYGGVFNILDRIFSFGVANAEREASMPTPSGADAADFFKNLLLPVVHFHVVKHRMNPAAKTSNILYTVILGALMYGSLCLGIVAAAKEGEGYGAVALWAYLGAASVIAGLRNQVRESVDIPGTIVEDFVASFFLFPNVLQQMVVATTSE